jgi:hypothetical protein
MRATFCPTHMMRAFMVPMSMCLCLSTAAWADELSSSLEQPIRETKHTVSADVEDGFAILTVQRAFVSAGPKVDEAVVEVNVPPGATADQLRIYARGTWYDGELLESQEAERLYRRLTGRGIAPLKDPAILYWRGHGQLGLQVFPLVPNQEVLLEYRLVVPLEFSDDTYAIRYPVPVPPSMRKSKDNNGDASLLPSQASLSSVTWRMARVDAGLAFAGINQVDAKAIKWMTAARTQARTTTQEVALWPALDGDKRPIGESLLRFAVRQPSALRARMARVELARDREAVRIELDVGTLSTLPSDVAMVFVLDTSHSVSLDGRRRQVEAAKAVLRHLPNARVQVVQFARTAAALTRSWLSSSSLMSPSSPAWDELMTTPPKNGSEMWQGVREANLLLAQLPPATTKRIIAFSDGNLRNTFEAADLQRALSPAGALLHVVHIDMSSDASTAMPTLLTHVDDDARLSKVVEGSGGVFAHLTAGTWSSAALSSSLLHLVRPTRLHGLRVLRAPSTANMTDRMPEEDAVAELASLMPGEDVVEGSSFRMSAGIDRHEVSTTMTGQLWGKTMTWKFDVPASLQRVSGALLLADEDADWTPFETMTLAVAAHAVSPVTSLLAMEPGTRPSREGMGGGHSSSGMGGAGRGRWPNVAPSNMVMSSWNHVLREELAACVAAAKPTGPFHAYFVLQRGFGEIMDVQPLVEDGSGMSRLQQCLYEALWNHTLNGQEPAADIVRLSG